MDVPSITKAAEQSGALLFKDASSHRPNSHPAFRPTARRHIHRLTEQIANFLVLTASVNHGKRPSMVVDGRALLVHLRQRLRQIQNRLIDIEARLDVLGANVVNNPLTLRAFTEKQLNDQIPDYQKTHPSTPRAAAQKYSTR
jgi:hypothetical protein